MNDVIGQIRSNEKEKERVWEEIFLKGMGREDKGVYREWQRRIERKEKEENRFEGVRRKRAAVEGERAVLVRRDLRKERDERRVEEEKRYVEDVTRYVEGGRSGGGYRQGGYGPGRY